MSVTINLNLLNSNLQESRVHNSVLINGKQNIINF